MPGDNSPKGGASARAAPSGNLEGQLTAAGLSGLERSEAKGLIEKFNPRDKADNNFKLALLTNRSSMPDQGSSLDRIIYLRRLSEKPRLSKEDSSDAGIMLRQGLRGGEGSPGNKAALEYAHRSYSRMTSAGKNEMARELTRGVPQDPLMSTNAKYRSMFADLQKRSDRLEAGEGRKTSRGKAKRIASEPFDDFFN